MRLDFVPGGGVAAGASDGSKVGVIISIDN